jgi:putative ABC transport system permease protein
MLVNDLRDAVRAMRRRPVYALVSIATLTLGVGAMLAIFSLANVLLFRPMPGVRAPGELMRVMRVSRSGDGFYPMSYALYEAVRDGTPAFSGVATRNQSTIDLAFDQAASPRRAATELVSGNYFDVLGVPVSAGRAITSRDVDEGLTVAVVTPGVCRSAAADDRCLTKTVLVNGLRYEIVGVMNDRFHGVDVPAAAELWLPMSSTLVSGRNDPAALRDRGTHFLLELIGRLRQGATLGQAQIQLDAVSAQAASWTPVEARSDRERRVTAIEGIGLRPGRIERVRAILTQLSAVAASLLLLTCLNLGTLWRARGVELRRDVAVRRALGASGGQVVRRQLTECLLIALVGSIAALVCCAALASQLGTVRILPFMPPLGVVTPDWRVMTAALVLAIGAGLAAGIVPSIMTARRDAIADLRSTTSTRPSRGLLGLISVQLALSFALLVCAAALSASVRNLLAVDLGYQTAGVVQATVSPSSHGYTVDRRRAFFVQLEQAMRTEPGVEDATLVWVAPFQGFSSRVSVYRAPGDTQAVATVNQNLVGAGYFSTLRIPLIAGRAFAPGEIFAAANPDVVILSRRLARQVFGDEAGALDRTIVTQRTPQRPLRVIGVAEDVRMRDVRGPLEPQLYEPLGQPRVPDFAFVLVRTRAPLREVRAAIEGRVAALDPSLSVLDAETVGAAVEASVSEERLLARLSIVLAGLAIVLASVGLFGIMAHGVTARAREFAIRVALGSAPARLVRLVLREALAVTIAGVVVGAVIAALLSRVIATRLFGIGALDPRVLGAGAAVLVLVATATAVVPARRAARVDPLDALKAE